jgi:hypothetical protein
MGIVAVVAAALAPVVVAIGVLAAAAMAQFVAGLAVAGAVGAVVFVAIRAAVDLAIAAFERVRPSLEAMGALAVRVGGMIWRSLVYAWDTIVATARPILAALTTIFGEIYDYIKAGVVYLADLWQRTWGVLVARVGPLVDAIAPIFDLVQRIGAAFMRTFGEILGTLLRAAWVNLQSIAGILFGPLVEAVGAFTGVAQSGFSSIGEFIDVVTERLQVVATWLRANLPAAIEAFVHRLGDGLLRLQGPFQTLFHWIKAVARAMETLGMVQAGTTQGLSAMFQSTLAALGDVAQQLLDFHIDLSDAGAAAAATGRLRSFDRTRGADKDKDGRTDVTKAGGQFETALDLWRRLNQTAASTAIPERTANAAERIRDMLERMANRGAPPANPVALPGQNAA